MRTIWRRRQRTKQLVWDVAEWLLVNRAYLIDRIINIFACMSFAFVVYIIHGTYVGCNGHNLGV